MVGVMTLRLVAGATKTEEQQNSEDELRNCNIEGRALELRNVRFNYIIIPWNWTLELFQF